MAIYLQNVAYLSCKLTVVTFPIRGWLDSPILKPLKFSLPETPIKKRHDVISNPLLFILDVTKLPRLLRGFFSFCTRFQMFSEEKVREENGVRKTVLEEAKLIFIHASLKAKIMGTLSLCVWMFVKIFGANMFRVPFPQGQKTLPNPLLYM